MYRMFAPAEYLYLQSAYQTFTTLGADIFFTHTTPDYTESSN